MAQHSSNSSNGLLTSPEGYQKLNNLTGIGIFILTLVTFYTTMAPTVSFWDCGEYIASCYSLGIPHPPGNPLYVLLGRVFTMIFFWTEQVAFRVNLMSILAGALTALTLFKIITRSLRGMLGEMNESWKSVVALVGGTTGALFGVFNYTFWFSAVEASVYIPAVFMVVVNVYLALVWAQSKAENRDKYLLLFSYVAFLGIGIHMMSMFALFPVFLYIIILDKSKLKDWRLWAVALLMGSVIYSMGAFIFIAPFLLLMTAVYAFLPRIASCIINLILPSVFYYLVLKNVNIEDGDTLPFVMLQIFAAIEMTIYLINRAKEEQRPHAWHFAFGIVFMAVLGYSVHAYIPIRSALEPMIDENHPVIEFTGSETTDVSRKLFIENIKVKENKEVKKAYTGYLRLLKADEKLNSMNEELLAAIKYAEYSKPIHEKMMDAVKEDSILNEKYQTFLAVMDEKPYRQTRALYRRYLASMNDKMVEWGAFRGFLERKQYGSESMITRMFHRRGAFSRQFGIDGHMGYGGFHITQFFHFGEDINVDRKGSGADGRDSFARNNVITGPLSPEVEAEMLMQTLSQEEVERISARMGASLDSIPAEEKLLAISAIDGELKNMAGVQKFLRDRDFMRALKRVGILFLYLIPTFLVLFSWGYWFKKDWKMATLLTTLLLTTSVALVLYMNFADGTRVDGPDYRQWLEQKEMYRAKGYMQDIPMPKPVHREVRIRDYFFTTGFTFFGMWIGLAIAALLHFFYSLPAGDFRRGIGSVIALLAFVSPALPFFQNYHENDRRSDWIPYDYAYNLLMSCERDGILFTNGDNDTFPLWFLQEAEGIRKDVRIVNLSLVNTKWYIHQLKRLDPKVPISYSEREIETTLNHQLNPFQKRITYPLEQAGIKVVPPTREEKRVLRIQDLMVLNIVDAAAWSKPIYFSVTVSPSNLMGLDPYLRQEGMVYRVMKDVVDRNDVMDFDRTKYLLDKVYRFRNLGDNTTPMSETARKLMNNYAAAFIQYNLALRPTMAKMRNEIVAMDSQISDTAEVIDSITGESVVVDSIAISASMDSLSGELDAIVDEVINKYDRCVAIMPWDVRARKYRQDFLMEVKRYDLARKRMEEAILIDPTNGLYRSWEMQLNKIAE